MSQGNAIFAFVVGTMLLSQTGCCCCVLPVGGPQPGTGAPEEFEGFLEPADDGAAIPAAGMEPAEPSDAIGVPSDSGAGPQED